jgi:hypothetical protein
MQRSGYQTWRAIHSRPYGFKRKLNSLPGIRKPERRRQQIRCISYREKSIRTLHSYGNIETGSSYCAGILQPSYFSKERAGGTFFGIRGSIKENRYEAPLGSACSQAIKY